MNESELKSAIIVLAELLKEETKYSVAVGRMMTATCRSILESSDEVRQRYERHFEESVFPIEPQSAESPLRKIGESLRRLDDIILRMKA